jgi:NTP pyrophosphatase (non-canonical NTP hydrolase)
MSYREQDIIQWGIDRNLIGPTGEATREGQQRKTEEEVQELRDAIEANDIDEAKDAIGDVYVTLVLHSQMWGLSMDECIDQAWSQIKDRKGRMINGVFVKESA